MSEKQLPAFHDDSGVGITKFVDEYESSTSKKQLSSIFTMAADVPPTVNTDTYKDTSAPVFSMFRPPLTYNTDDSASPVVVKRFKYEYMTDHDNNDTAEVSNLKTVIQRMKTTKEEDDLKIISYRKLQKVHSRTIHERDSLQHQLDIAPDAKSTLAENMRLQHSLNERDKVDRDNTGFWKTVIEDDNVGSNGGSSYERFQEFLSARDHMLHWMIDPLLKEFMGAICDEFIKLTFPRFYQQAILKFRRNITPEPGWDKWQIKLDKFVKDYITPLFEYSSITKNEAENVVGSDDTNTEAVAGEQNDLFLKEWQMAVAPLNDHINFMEIPTNTQYFKNSYVERPQDIPPIKTTDEREKSERKMYEKHDEEMSKRFNNDEGWNKFEQQMLERRKEMYEYGLQEFISLYNKHSVVLVGALWVIGWQVFNRQFPMINYQHMRYWRTPNHAGPRQLNKYERMCWVLGISSVTFYHTVQMMLVQFAGIEVVPHHLGDDARRLYASHVQTDLTDDVERDPVILNPTTSPVVHIPKSKNTPIPPQIPPPPTPLDPTYDMIPLHPPPAKPIPPPSKDDLSDVYERGWYYRPARKRDHPLTEDDLARHRRIWSNERAGRMIYAQTHRKQFKFLNNKGELESQGQDDRGNVYKGGPSFVYYNLDYYLHNDMIEYSQLIQVFHRDPSLNEEQYKYICNSQFRHGAMLFEAQNVKGIRNVEDDQQKQHILREAIWIQALCKIKFDDDGNFLQSTLLLKDTPEVMYLLTMDRHYATANWRTGMKINSRGQLESWFDPNNIHAPAIATDPHNTMKFLRYNIDPNTRKIITQGRTRIFKRKKNEYFLAQIGDAGLYGVEWGTLLPQGVTRPETGRSHLKPIIGSNAPSINFDHWVWLGYRTSDKPPFVFSGMPDKASDSRYPLEFLNSGDPNKHFEYKVFPPFCRESVLADCENTSFDKSSEVKDTVQVAYESYRTLLAMDGIPPSLFVTLPMKRFNVASIFVTDGKPLNQSLSTDKNPGVFFTRNLFDCCDYNSGLNSQRVDYEIQFFKNYDEKLGRFYLAFATWWDTHSDPVSHEIIPPTSEQYFQFREDWRDGKIT